MTLLARLFLAFILAVAPVAASAQLPLTGAGPGGFGSTSVAFQAENRTATLALSPDATTTGDSIPFGVGVADSGTYSFQNQLDALLTSGNILENAVSGSAWNLPAWTGLPGNPDPIPDEITGSVNYTVNTHLTMGSVNGYNSVVVQGGATEMQAWVSYIESGIASALAPLSQPWVYFTGIHSEGQGPGMLQYASWRYLHKELTADYGGRIYDIHRALQFRGSSDTNTLDYKNVQQWGGLPLSFRGQGGAVSAFSNATLPTAWLTCNTATNTAAGIAAAAGCGDPTLRAEGAFAQNLSTSGSVPSNSHWRVANVAGTRTWERIDPLHFSRWGSQAWAGIALDILAARQGTGAPVGNPARLYCAQDVASGGSCGTIDYIGSAAPATAALFTYGGTPVTTLNLAVNAPSAGKGTITVTRSSSGTFTEGTHPQYILQTTNGSGGVIHSPVDLYIGEPSTQTVPRMWLIPGAVGNESSSFSVVGKAAHGLDNGGQYFIGAWLKPVSIASDIEYIVDLHNANGDSARLFVRISTGGNLTVVAQDTTSAAVVFNNNIGTAAFADGLATWFLFDIDFTVATPTIRGVRHKAGDVVNTSISTNSSLSAGPYTFNMSKTDPRFFALADASFHDQNRGAAPIATRDQYTGSFGEIIVGNGLLGLAADPTIANALWNPANGAPVARACGAAIAGKTPVWDWRGGVDDLLMGGCMAGEPLFGTESQVKNLTANP